MGRGKYQRPRSSPAGRTSPGPRPGLPSPLVTALLALVFLTGLGLLLYPTVSELWNGYNQSQAIVTYAQEASGMDETQRKALWDAATAYNASLAQKRSQNWELSQEEKAQYDALLSATTGGVMGYVEIPSIQVSLPIYHGTGEVALQKGAGHLTGSSLPVGGESTHTVLSSHRGLPSARLFTDLDRLQAGDVFYLHVLGETLAYAVDQILTVEPHETQALEIVPGEDYCTLFTCTPYGINTHRLLVRGHRTEMSLTPQEEPAPTAETTSRAVPGNAGFVLAAVLLLVALLGLGMCLRKKKKRKGGTAS